MQAFQVISLSNRLEAIVGDGLRYKLSRDQLEDEILELASSLRNYAKTIELIETASQAIILMESAHVN